MEGRAMRRGQRVSAWDGWRDHCCVATTTRGAKLGTSSLLGRPGCGARSARELPCRAPAVRAGWLAAFSPDQMSPAENASSLPPPLQAARRSLRRRPLVHPWRLRTSLVGSVVPLRCGWLLPLLLTVPACVLCAASAAWSLLFQPIPTTLAPFSSACSAARYELICSA
jgi:hypothetical protein